MKQSTFSAVMANSIKNLLQGYTKGIRFVAVLTILLTMGIGQAWGETYTKVTSAPADWSGEYIIVYESNNTAHVWTGVDAAKCNTTADISSNSVTGDFITVTIAPMTGGYSIKVNGGTNSGKYIYGTSGSNKVNFGSAATANTLSYESTWVKITSNTSVLTFNDAANDMRFRYYKSTSYNNMKKIQLYKKKSAAYTFHYGEKDKSYQKIDFKQVVGTTNEWQITDFVFPDVNTNQACYVGYNGYWYNSNLGASNSKSADLYFWNMPLAKLQNDNACSNVNYLGWDMNSQNGHKVIGTLRIYDNDYRDNLAIAFVPNGYGLCYGKDGQAWSNIAFNGNDDVVTTNVITLTKEMIDGTYKYYVGLLTSDGGYSYCGNSSTLVMNTIGSYYNISWHDNLGQYSSGQAGVFRIWTNSCNGNNTPNFVCHFVPYYRVSYDLNGGNGTALPSQWYSCESGTQTITLPAKPTRDGYRFKGWGTLSVDATTYSFTPTSNVTLQAQWEKVYTVTFDLQGHGTAIAQQTVVAGNKATRPTDPTATGYTFGGWYKESACTNVFDFNTAINTNTTIYAKWTAKKYTYTLYPNTPAGATVIFKDNEGNSVDEIQITQTYGETAQSFANFYSEISCEGYRFDGWYSATSGGSKWTQTQSKPADNGVFNFYARWIKVHTITWKVNGTTHSTTTVDNGDPLVLPSPDPTAPSSCSDKVFMGWTESATVNNDGKSITYISTSTKPDSDKTYHAVFATETSEETTTTISKTKIEDFEKQTDSNEYNQTKTYTAVNSNAGIAWKMYYGTVSTNAVLNGSKSAQMRWYSSASANLPYIQSTTLVKGLKSISFTTLTSDNDYKYSVSYSTNGTSWTSVATGQSVGSTSNKQTKSYTINANGVDAYIKIAITSTSNVSDKATFRIDDVVFTYLESTTTTETKHSDYVTSCTPQYTITLDLDGGVFDETPDGWIKVDENTYTQVVNENTVVTLPTPTKKGYTYKGWRKNSLDNPVTSITATETATYTAVYDCALNSVGISGSYALVSGQQFQLTATAYDENGAEIDCPDNTEYAWQRRNPTTGNWEEVTDNDGVGKTLTYPSCEVAHCGLYRCHITYGDCGAWSHVTAQDNGYNVRVLHLKGSFESDWTKAYAFTATDQPGIATLKLDLTAGNTYNFKIYDGISEYGNGGIIEGTTSDWWDYGSDNNQNTTLKTGADGSYEFTLDFTSLLNSGYVLKLKVSYPPTDQASGKTIYYDNLVHNWANIYYRIGHSRANDAHNTNTKLTLVPGTSHLYKCVTGEYNAFEAWHIANNVSWSGNGNSIYLVNPDGTEYDITHATEYQKYAVVEDITLTPDKIGTKNNVENCTYYPVTKQSGMKTWKATVIPAVGGTITVKYTHHDGTEVNDFTSGDRDLAHTCLLTITATPDAGYKLGTLTVNDVAFTSGDVHTLTENAVIKAEYAKATYTVTFNGNDADGGSTAPVSGEYQAEVTLTPNGFTRTGYTFTGWNTQADGTGEFYGDGETFTIPSQDITLYAQWAQAYTITWMVAGVALEGDALGDATTSVNPGAGITDIPTTPPADNTLEDCGATKFMGWSTVNIGSIPQADAPGDLFTTSEQAQELTIDGNKTFYAVFASAEGEDIDYSNVHTSNATISAGSRCTASKVIIDEQKYDAMKAGTSSYSGSIEITVPAGTTNLYFKMAGWNGKGGKTITLSGATADPTTFKTIADAGINGTGTEYTLEGNIADYSYSVTLEGITAQTTLVFSNSAKEQQFVIWGANAASITYSNYVTQCCTDWTPTLTYSKTTLDSETNETATPTITGNTHNAQVSFESSNESVLTVDANNGTITAVGAGKATITATWAKTDDYCGKSITTDEITVNGKFLVTFHANDGSGNTTTQQIPSNTATALNANTFQRDGYTFQGWATSASGAKVYDDGQEVTLSKSGLDLYAVWQVKAYNITTGTITGEGTITTSPANSANCDAQVTITATPAAHYTLTSVVVTRDDNSQTVDVVGNNFTMPASDVTITAEFTENEKFAINYAIPTGGGEVADDAPTWIYSDGSITLPGIKDGTISSEYSCEEFIGWTTLTSYESYEGAMPTPFYNAGDELSDITEATTLRPVYSRAGNGPSGTVELTCTDVATWKSDVLGGNNNSYGTIITRTATDGSVWTTNGQIQNAGGISLKENYYIQIPTLPGPMTTITMKVSQGSLGNDDACYEYIASPTSRAFHFRSAADGSNLFSSNTVAEASRSRTIEITEGNYTTGYIINGEGTSYVHAITVAYGSPNIISTSLNCSNDIDEFTITYNTNYGSARGQIPTGTVVNGACDNSGEPIRFEDLPNGEYTICNSLTATQYKLVGWNSQANGNGGLSYEPGDVITMVPQSDITLYAQWVPEVIMLDNQDRTITYQETVGEAITLPAGAYTCDGKYTFVGWTTDNVDSWNQKITKPTLVAELNGNDETLFVPTEPTVVYAVYKLETTANSKAFYLKSDNNYYAQKHDTYVLTGTDDIADATRLYRQQINVESPNNYWLYYLDDEQQKRFVYINTASLGSLFSPSIGDGETTPEDTKGWEFVSVTGGYKLKALGTYGNSVGIVTHYMHTNESGNMRSNTTGSVYTIETATEINYYAYPTCSDEITITFETRGGTLIPNDHPYVLTKKEGDVITLPGCEYAGLDFIGWVNEPIEPTEIIANPEDIYEAEEEYVVGDQNIVLYAYYSQTPESAEYDGKSDGEWKIYAYADGEYHFAVAPNSEEDDMSTVTICDKSTTWTFTNVAENQYYIQDEAGRYIGVRPAIENKNDFRFTDEPVIWTIDSKGNDLYRLTCETNTDRVMLYDNGRIRYSSHTQEGNPEYFYVTIGGCFNPIYTTDPARLQAVSVYGTVQITSTFGQTVKAMDKLTLVVRHAEPESYIRFSSPNVTFYDESGNVITTALVESQKQQIPLVVAYTPDVADNRIARPAITVTAKTLNPSTGTYVETNYSVNGRISARSLPADFAIVAKVGNLWYALPSQGLNSTDALVGYPVEVDNQNDPTAVTAVPDNADWSLRQVYAASHSDAQKDRFKLNGANIMFENNASPAKMLNACSSDNYLLTDAEYDSYETSDYQGFYEWTPTTTDLETYTLTNAQRTDRTLNVSVNTVFGVHAQNVATNSLRFLPINDRYKPLALQVVEWKENSIVVMYNGDPEQTASVSVNGGEAQTTTLSDDDAQRDIAVYELVANGLAANPTQRLSITIGTEKLLLPIPYIVNSNTTDATLTSNNKTLAAVSDLVVLNGKTFTADAATSSKYTFRNVTVYGGGSLIIPSGKGLGVNSLTMRVGAVVDDNYQNLYPSMLLAGAINTGNINIDYLTTADYYYPLSVPEEVTIRDIKYPVDIYGSNVDKDNTGSFRLKYYDGEQRVDQGSQYGTGWVVVNENTTTTLEPNQGYAIWGIPKKINGTRQTYGIHRIPISTTADKLATNEKTEAEVQIEAHGDASTPPNDRGWNYLGNPYLAQLGGMDGEDEDLQMGLLEKEKDANGDWTGGWVYNNEQVRYITVTNDCQNFEAKRVADATIPAFSTFFIQASKNGAILLTAPANPEPASIAARHYAAQQEAAKEITTGILLTGNDQTDRTGLLIADNFTEEYDYNADLSKFENSGINLYTIGKDGKLAFMAINQTLAEQPIPVGYTAPAEGLYTIAFDEDRYNATDISALYLIDYDSNEKTNLLHTDYSFVTAAGTNNQRFALQVAFAPANATNIEWVGDATIQVGVEGNTLMLNNLPTDAAVHVFDALGRLMYHAPTVPTEMQLTLPTGYYLVRIADKQNAVVIKTVIP